jgi:UDP-N-acetylglucosamine 2-epimerase (non-hydrolysing)
MTRVDDSRHVAVLIGTRPEAIKLMPVIRALEDAAIPLRVLVTGQHRELLDPILAELGIKPDENLQLMTAGQSLAEISARVLSGSERLFRARRPRVVVIQGDTTSVAMGALAAFYEGIAVAHVEAGLRTGNTRNPFPEEINRRLVACVADVHFAPTERARESLLRESVPPEHIHVVGNTVIDALFLARDRFIGTLEPDPMLEEATRRGRRVILVTAHRRESFGADLDAICLGLRAVARQLSEAVQIVFPVHLNPSVQSQVRASLGDLPNVRLLPPVQYLSFVRLLSRSSIVITDSGGVQEEAAALGVPTLVVRHVTERAEAVEAGVAQLVGPHTERIIEAVHTLLTDKTAYGARAIPTNAFGDGFAATRIVDVLKGLM